MADGEYKLINERVGFWGAVGLLVGTTIGMSIFIVPTQMMALAGPSITLAILVCVIPMIFAVLGTLQLGGAIPVAGGAYVYLSRLVGPFVGMVGVTFILLGIWAYLLFAGLGFAEYLIFFSLEFDLVPEIPRALVVWAILLAFLVINILGIRIVAAVQLSLAGLLIVGLLVFVIVGIGSIELDNFTPLFPAEGNEAPFASGYTPFLIAIISLYLPFQGYSMIVEIGEELENPIKNIPRVLALGMAVVTLISVAVVAVLVGIIHWRDAPEIVETGGGLASAINSIAPTEIAFIVAVAALIGAATTVNTLLTSYSRTIMRAARDDVLPPRLAAIHNDYNTPYAALGILAIPPILATPWFVYIDGIVAVDVLDWLVAVVVTAIFAIIGLMGIGLWRLPTIFPNRYEHSFYKLPLPLLKVVAVGNAAISFLLIGFIALAQPTVFVLFVFWAIFTYAFYRLRLRTHADGPKALKKRMQQLHSHE